MSYISLEAIAFRYNMSRRTWNRYKLRIRLG